MAEQLVRQDTAGVERAVVEGDLGKLTPEERLVYYARTCESLGLNPLTRPFQYITLNSKLTLYATRGATDQLRALHGVTILDVNTRLQDGLCMVTVRGRDTTGREDVEVGAVPIDGLKGEALANATMKALTKAKRRLTLALVGLGWLDESEVGSIPNARPVNVNAETGEIIDEVPALSPPPASEAQADYDHLCEALDPLMAEDSPLSEDLIAGLTDACSATRTKWKGRGWLAEWNTGLKERLGNLRAELDRRAALDEALENEGS